MKVNIILFLIVCSGFVSAQNSRDSLSKYTFPELSSRFYQYANNDEFKKARQLSTYYLQRAKSSKDPSQIAEGYVMMHFTEKLPAALQYIDSLQNISKNLDKKIYPARIYLLRGNLYFKHDNQKLALNNYVLGLKYAKIQKNERQIAFANISIAYLNNYIGKHLEAAKTLRYYWDHGSYLTEPERYQIHLNLADTYTEINKMDSAKIFIEEGLNSSLKKDDSHRYHQYLSLQGFYNLKLKKYPLAIKDLLASEKFFSTNNNDTNLNYVLLNLGKAYWGTNDKEKAIEYFSKIDSTIQKTNNTFPELREVYTYLIEYYKEKKDKEKQLYYIERFIDIDKILDSQFRYVSRELPRRYDTPRLVKEKEDIISDLEKRRTLLYSSLCISVLVLILIAYLYLKSKKTEKKYRKIAHDLIISLEEQNKINSSLPEAEPLPTGRNYEQHNIKIEEKQAIKTISKDVSESILNELQTFEAKEKFLAKGITLAKLAKTLKTNTTYLSDIINTHKGKNFATYLNDLRIDYALNKLITDKKFRSYKISAIAEELGYNNEQAFSLAFKKKTGTPLSIYLKEIEKLEKSPTNF
ncbi:helix-turn-helix domain-containing protein [Chryseobacterium sp. CT-SW4]|uniref:helix-turn-helix domain-containing protein n=1 Tax=Chryseobacterium sp. SW-1 TaxID=3157343 RepID=UPI003B0158C8